MDTLGRCCHVNKRDSFFDFLYGLEEGKALLPKYLIQHKTAIDERDKTHLTELPPLQVYPFPMKIYAINMDSVCDCVYKPADNIFLHVEYLSSYVKSDCLLKTSDYDIRYY